jgi:hypothetical protein
MAKLRSKMNKADEAYIEANLDKNSLEISEEIGLDQLVVADFLKAARKDKIREPGRLRVNGKVIGATLTDAMAEYEPKKDNNGNLDAPYIFRRQNKKDK